MRLSPTPCRVCFRPRVFNWSLLTEMRHIDRHTTPLVTLGYSTTHEYQKERHVAPRVGLCGHGRGRTQAPKIFLERC